MIVIVYTGETDAQAAARTAGWTQERRELLGYQGDTFIFRGRRCVSSRRHSAPEFRRVAESVNTANARHRQQIERDRRYLLRTRALREARDFNEAIRLMKEYGVA